MGQDDIINGTGIISMSGIILTDARVSSARIGVDKAYSSFINELTAKRDAEAIASKLEEQLSELTYLADAEFEAIRNLVNPMLKVKRREDRLESGNESDIADDKDGVADNADNRNDLTDGANGQKDAVGDDGEHQDDNSSTVDSAKCTPGKERLAGGRTLEEAKNIISAFKGLVSRNKKLLVDDILYKQERQALERKIVQLDVGETDQRIREMVADDVKLAKEWLRENGDNKDHVALSKKIMELARAHIKATNAVKEIDRKKREELEKAEKLVEEAAKLEGDTAKLTEGEKEEGAEMEPKAADGSNKENEPPVDSQIPTISEPVVHEKDSKKKSRSKRGRETNEGAQGEEEDRKFAKEMGEDMSKHQIF